MQAPAWNIMGGTLGLKSRDAITALCAAVAGVALAFWFPKMASRVAHASPDAVAKLD